MELLVVSDTHGRADRLAEVLQRTRAHTLLFLGDGLRDLYVVPSEVTVRAVRGNCDFFSHEDAPLSRVEDFGKYRVFLTHGHAYSVKSSLSAAITAAAAAGADVLLYGHTHRPLEKTVLAGEVLSDGSVLEKDLLVVCPGSLGYATAGEAAFATLTLRENGVLAGFGT